MGGPSTRMRREQRVRNTRPNYPFFEKFMQKIGDCSGAEAPDFSSQLLLRSVFGAGAEPTPEAGDRATLVGTTGGDTDTLLVIQCPLPVLTYLSPT